MIFAFLLEKRFRFLTFSSHISSKVTGPQSVATGRICGRRIEGMEAFDYYTKEPGSRYTSLEAKIHNCTFPECAFSV